MNFLVRVRDSKEWWCLWGILRRDNLQLLCIKIVLRHVIVLQFHQNILFSSSIGNKVKNNLAILWFFKSVIYYQVMIVFVPSCVVQPLFPCSCCGCVTCIFSLLFISHAFWITLALITLTKFYTQIITRM